jgi:hypothetical protein
MIRKAILMFAVLTALFTAANSAVGAPPECGDNCPFVQ